MKRTTTWLLSALMALPAAADSGNLTLHLQEELPVPAEVGIEHLKGIGIYTLKEFAGITGGPVYLMARYVTGEGTQHIPVDIIGAYTPMDRKWLTMADLDGDKVPELLLKSSNATEDRFILRIYSFNRKCSFFRHLLQHDNILTLQAKDLSAASITIQSDGSLLLSEPFSEGNLFLKGSTGVWDYRAGQGLIPRPATGKTTCPKGWQLGEHWAAAGEKGVARLRTYTAPLPPQEKIHPCHVDKIEGLLPDDTMAFDRERPFTFSQSTRFRANRQVYFGPAAAIAPVLPYEVTATITVDGTVTACAPIARNGKLPLRTEKGDWFILSTDGTAAPQPIQAPQFSTALRKDLVPRPECIEWLDDRHFVVLATQHSLQAWVVYEEQGNSFVQVASGDNTADKRNPFRIINGTLIQLPNTPVFPKP